METSKGTLPLSELEAGAVLTSRPSSTCEQAGDCSAPALQRGGPQAAASTQSRLSPASPQPPFLATNCAQNGCYSCFPENVTAPQNSMHARTHTTTRVHTHMHTHEHTCTRTCTHMRARTESSLVGTIHLQGPQQKPQVVRTALGPCDKPAGSKACWGGGCSSNWSMCPGSVCCGATNLSEDKNTNTSASYFRPTDLRASVGLLQAAPGQKGSRATSPSTGEPGGPPALGSTSHSPGHILL